MLDVRKAQRNALKKTFKLHVEGVERSEDQFKILIFDLRTREIVRQLFTKPELSELGVTTHLLLTDRRGMIPDAPALYFVEPTGDNIDRICKDSKEGLYDRIYLSFSSEIPKDLLSSLARRAASDDFAHRIIKVYDEFCSMVCYEKRLFSLALPRTYFHLNNKFEPDAAIQSLCTKIVDGIFSALVTLKCLPIIRTPNKPNSPAYEISKMLFQKLQSQLQNRNNLFSNASYQRPLLVVFDRTEDLALPLHHGCTYQALINDLLEVPAMNQVKVEGDGGRLELFDLDEKDEFWAENQGKAFPEVTESHGRLLNWYKAKSESITKGKDTSGDVQKYEDELEGIKKLMEGVMTLPQLNQKWNIISMHAKITGAIVSHLEKRLVADYFNYEEDFLTGAFASVKELKEHIKKDQLGSIQDKIRAFLVYYVCQQGTLSSSELAAWTNELAAHDDAAPFFNNDVLKPLAFVRSVSKNSHLTLTGGMSPDMSTSAGLFNFAGDLFGKVATKLLPKNKNCVVSQILDNLMGGCGVEHEEYEYFDPAARKGQHRHRSQMRDAIVFMVGGGNHSEFQNLQDFASQRAGPTKKIVIYGTTDMITPEEFLQTLTDLGA